MDEGLKSFLKELDERLRQTGVCPNCGKPRSGILRPKGNYRARGFRGNAYYEPEGREEAGMCTCKIKEK